MAKEKIRVKLRGFDVELVDQSSKAIVQAVQKVGAKVLGPIPLPTLIDIIEPSADVMNALMALELSAGVDVEIKQ